MNDRTIAFIGAGNMASALFGGLARRGWSAGHLRAADPSAECRDRAAAMGITVTADNAAAIDGADVVVLAVKPQVMHDVVAPLADAIARQRPLVISIAAGVRLATLERWLGADTAIVRCMPNTPALVGTGVTALFGNRHVDADGLALATAVLNAVGTSVAVDSEEALDAVTAVSGSGPAYYFLVMEAMIAAAGKLGLEPGVARELTLQTALGAARMAVESDVGPDELRRRVTSPNGTTERAVAAFEHGGLRELFAAAMEAAAERSRELSRELDCQN